MFLVSEVHPFADGNGRAARIMSNAELAIGDQERIIIPIVCRDNYLSAQKALTLNGNTAPLIRMMDYAQAYTAAVDWTDLTRATKVLERTNAFQESQDAPMTFGDCGRREARTPIAINIPAVHNQQLKDTRHG